MRHSFLLTIILSLIGTIYTTAQNREVEYSLSPFHSIIATHSFQVTLIESSTNSATIEAHPSLLEYLSVEVKSGVLKLTLKPSTPDNLVREGRKVAVTLHYNKLLHIALYDNASLKNEDQLKQERLSVVLRGSSSIEIKGDIEEASYKLLDATKATLTNNCNSLKIETAGAAEVMVEGSIKNSSLLLSGSTNTIFQNGSGEQLLVKSSGASSLNSLNFPFDKVTLEATGLSYLKVNTQKNLIVDATGGVSVEYKGDPQLERVEVTALSTFVKIE